MKKAKRTSSAFRWVSPPQPLLLPLQVMPVNRVLGVYLASGEKVHWIWSVTSNGIRYASGYEILKK